MYNSILVNMLANIWNLVEKSYEKSFLKKIVDCIKRFFIFLFNGSVIKSFFIEDKAYLSNSLLFKIYKFLINLYNKIFTGLNKFFGKYKNNSMACVVTKKYLEDDETSIATLIKTLRFLFVGMLLVNIFVKKNIYTLAVFIVLILVLSSNFIEYFKTSMIYRFCEYMFSVDEGGDQWW